MNAHSKKYFFFDIDGTLTDNATGEIIPSAKKAIDLLLKRGHFVSLATGRAHYKARKFMNEIGLHNMVCGGGGSIVINDKLIYNIPLEFNKAQKIIDEAEKLGIGILLMLDDSTKLYSKNDNFRIQVGNRKEPTEYIIDSNLDYKHLIEIFKIYLSISKEDEHLLTTKTILGNLRFVPEYLMFQYDEKDKGIKEMIKLINGSLTDVVVFGDDYNDLVMFDSIWTNIAMGNACKELKDKATFVTKSNIEDGILYACEKMDWI
ncbi:MAG: HAD family phosphatase [Erysipelotrichaceae bacterium]|nr:HAD family phosphatase [Erysipelotrichaceae bacterium]